MPDNKRGFHLYLDTSKFATGSVLYQIQNGQPRLIAYASKQSPVAQNYSITELELCGLAINCYIKYFLYRFKYHLFSKMLKL